MNPWVCVCVCVWRSNTSFLLRFCERISKHPFKMEEPQLCHNSTHTWPTLHYPHTHTYIYTHALEQHKSTLKRTKRVCPLYAAPLTPCRASDWLILGPQHSDFYCAVWSVMLQQQQQQQEHVPQQNRQHTTGEYMHMSVRVYVWVRHEHTWNVLMQ